MISSPAPRRVRTPSWFDLRLLAGAALVVVSVIVGAVVVANAQRSMRVWAVSRDLAGGVVLTSGDLRAVAVRLPEQGRRYFAAGSSPVGQALNRPVSAGELLARTAVGRAAASTTVTIPLTSQDAPTIVAGERIAVWVSTKYCPSAVVLADTAVQEVHRGGGGFGADSGQSVVVRLDGGQAARVIEVLALPDAVLRAGVQTGPVAPAPATLPPLAGCTADGS